MKARFTWIAVFAVLCSSAAGAQTDTATTSGTTPVLTQDTAGLGAGTTAPVTGTDTAGMSAAAPPAMTDTGTMMMEQMPADTAITTSTTTTAVAEEEEEGGFDWNWLGLLGLLGLTGLFKKRGKETTVVHHDTVRPVVDRNDPPGTRPRV
jgi:hypothetical protein